MSAVIPHDSPSGPHFFEGREKKLEVDFSPVPGNKIGLRAVPECAWARLLEAAECYILSAVENDHCTAYVLSESSLFVYPYKVILKTCGTTTLLKSLPLLKQYAQEYASTKINFACFARKNLLRPEGQRFPHTSATDELDYLNRFFEGGRSYVLGPVNGDHWNLYIADSSPRRAHHPDVPIDQTLEILMHDLDPRAMEPFFKDKDKDTDASPREKTERAIDGLQPGSVVDSYFFDPCGYSMNGLHGRSYSTIHVTPEADFSFVSYETNVQMKDYSSLVQAVLRIFRPRAFTVSLFSDVYDEHVERSLGRKAFEGYRVDHKASYEFEGRYDVLMCSYAAED